MKDIHASVSISSLCQCFDISRQAWYQHERDLAYEVFQYGILFDEIKDIRKGRGVNMMLY